jgi:hypothetical protein
MLIADAPHMSALRNVAIAGSVGIACFASCVARADEPPISMQAGATPLEAIPTSDLATQATGTHASMGALALAPPGYHVEQKPRDGLVAGGAILFGVSYALALVPGVVLAGARGPDWGCNATGPCPTARSAIPFFIPGVGPFIAAGVLSGGSSSGGAAAICVFDGLAQVGGIAMLAYGLAKHSVVAPDRKAATFALTPAPLVGNGRTGMGLVGTF